MTREDKTMDKTEDKKREVKRTLKSIMVKKNIKLGQLATMLDAEPVQTSVWFARDDGQSIEKIIKAAELMGCTMAFIDKETGAVYNVN